MEQNAWLWAVTLLLRWGRAAAGGGHSSGQGHQRGHSMRKRVGDTELREKDLSLRLRKVWEVPALPRPRWGWEPAVSSHHEQPMALSKVPPSSGWWRAPPGHPSQQQWAPAHTSSAQRAVNHLLFCPATSTSEDPVGLHACTSVLWISCKENVLW